MQKILIIFAVVFMTACTAHKIPIQQGNIVTQKQVAMLKPGLERRQVLFILGDPLLKDPFREDRWDYYYSMKPSGGEATTRYVLSLFFKGRKLARYTTRGPIPEEAPKDLPTGLRKRRF